MSEDAEPHWLADLAKGGETLRHQVEPIVHAAEQFVLDARRAKNSGGAALPFPQRLVLAVDAGIRELLPPPEPVVHQISLSGTITMSGSLTLRPMRFIADGDVATATESGAVEVLDSGRGLTALSDGQIVVLVLVWLFAFVLPVLGPDMPSKLHAVLTDSYATFALALAITWRVRDKQR